MENETTDTGNIAEFTVSELSFALKRTVEDTYSYVRVRGELGRISRPGSGHIYLDLKDDKAVLAGVVWRGVASKLKIQPEQGLEVIATGRLTTYPGQSKYQIVIEAMEPAGLGALMALLEERRKKLAAEGLFDDARKQLIPYLPRVIGVVTSPTGAVIRDILHRLADRYPTHVLVWPVRVQGETSAGEVAAGINGFNALAEDGRIPRPDLIIVARGGGSVEDLWGFNEEAVVRAAAASDIPLISAVGHETDWTLLDHAADVRAPTPTGAAEMAVPVRAELMASQLDLAGRLQRAILRLYDERKNSLRAAIRGLPKLDDLLALSSQRLDNVQARLGTALGANTQIHHARYRQIAQRAGHGLQLNLESAKSAFRVLAGRVNSQNIERRLTDLEARLNDRGERLRRIVGNDLQDRLMKLDAQSKLMRSLGYQNVLERGFLLARDDGGQMLARAEKTVSDQHITLEFFDGQVGAQVTGPAGDRPVTPKTPGKQKSPKSKKSGKGQAGQGQLF